MQKLTHYTRRRADRHFRIFSNSPTPTPGYIFRVLVTRVLTNEIWLQKKKKVWRRFEQSENKFHTNISVSCVESFLVSCTIGDEFNPEKSPRRLDERRLVTATKFSETGRFFIIAISYSNVVTSAKEGDKTSFQVKSVETELHSVSLGSWNNPPAGLSGWVNIRKHWAGNISWQTS